MEKIVIDKGLCLGCGLCVHSHPEYLVFDEMNQAEPIDKEVEPSDKESILETIGNCPTSAIKIENMKTENE